MLRRRQRRGLAVSAAAAVLAAVSLTACGSGSSSSDPHAAITFFTDNTSWKDGFQKVGDQMEKITGHNLKMQSIPVSANFQQTLDQSLSAKPADIVKSSNGLQLQRLAATGNLTDLTSVWDAAVKKGWLDDSIRKYYTYDGKVYAVPMTRSYWVMFYNKHVFEQNNIAVPTTYAEFEAACAALKKAGVAPIWTEGADGWTPFIPYQTLLGSVSGDFYEKLRANDASFADSESVQAMTIWQKWMKDGWTTPYDAKATDAPTQFAAGKIGIMPIGTWGASMFKAAGMTPGKDYGAFLMPQVDPSAPQTVFFEGNGLAVPKRAAHHDAAVKQIAAWLDPNVQKVWGDYLGDASPNITVPVSNPVIADIANQINSGNTQQLIRYFEAVPSTLVTDSTTIWGNFMLHPDDLDKTVTQLKDAQTKDWDLWKQQNG